LVGNVIIIIFWDVTRLYIIHFIFIPVFLPAQQWVYVWNMHISHLWLWHRINSAYWNDTEMDILLPPKKMLSEKTFPVSVLWIFSETIFHIFVYATCLNMSVISSSLAFYKCGEKMYLLVLFIYFYFLSEFVKVSCHSFNTNNDKTDKRKKVKLCNIKPFEL